ncbi:MAG TPA: carboxypeptidase regulatory-like domain-containing protein [Candidatus Binatia bacterium]
MLKKMSLAIAIAIVATTPFSQANVLGAASAPPVALTGQVSSEAEGRMEGVLVSAKREGSTITTTVVSDAQGRYSFPASKLEPGRYALAIRAVGYELDGPKNAEVTAQKASQLDLKLNKAQDLAAQLSNGEWLVSMPGTEEQKQNFLGCIGCHTVERITRSKYNADDFVHVLKRMRNYAQGSVPGRAQFRPGGREPNANQLKQMQSFAQYVSTINLSKVPKWEYPLKTYPRPKGTATKVIITEYDLPRPEAMPHDAVMDSEGMVWYSDFGSLYLGRLDPKTAKAVEWPVPVAKPGAPTGMLDVNFDPEGNVWLGLMYQGSIAKFDRKTLKFQTWSAPKFMENNEARLAMVDARNFHLDGKVWIGGDNEYQLDVKTGEWYTVDYAKGLPKNAPPADRLSSYGVISDSKNNFYGTNLNGQYIIRVDGKTRDVTPFPTPTPNSGPRRGHMDPQDRLWFAEFRGNMIGMFDTKTERTREWAVTIPWTNPYDAVLDKEGYAWTGGMSNDYIVRLNTKTEEFTGYLLPRTTNVRRVNVDNSTSPPTFWVGNNNGAAIIKIEPLE